MKAKDIKLLGCIICILALFFFLRYHNSDAPAAGVLITVSGSPAGQYPLNVDRDITLAHNTIHIADGTVSISDADCPDRLCVHQGAISHAGEVIACLPNRVTVQIISDRTADITMPVTYSGIHFDTLVDVKIYDTNTPVADLPDIIKNECDRYELICSRTDPDSELYRLNNRTITETGVIIHDGRELTSYRISDELYDMIEAGLTAYRTSGGPFDISIAPVSSLWDFTRVQGTPPQESDIEAAVIHVSAENIILSDDNYIGFTDDECMIDLGGLAKGYIGDRLKSLLTEYGVTSAIISLGGNVVALGDKNGTPYTVGIRKPFSDTTSVITTVAAADTSVITSGNYERYFTWDGTLYHHILDPRTGYPYDTDLSSATVICKSSLQGDILSTTLIAEGREAAIIHADMLKKEGIYVILIDDTGSIIYDSHPAS